jgi:hypothetical protein
VIAPYPKVRCHAETFTLAVTDGYQIVPVLVERTPAPHGFLFRVTQQDRTLCEGFLPNDQADALRCAAWEAGRRLVWEKSKLTMLFNFLRENNLEAGRPFPVCGLGEQCPQGQQARQCPERCCSPICRAWEPAPEPARPRRRRSLRLTRT